MAKYHPEDIKQRAQKALNAKLVGDDRYFDLIMRLTLATGLGTDDIEHRIERLANGN